MSHQTIITVESYDDSVTRNMLRSLYVNDDFQEFAIYHCFISEVHNFTQLYEILTQSIKEHNTSIVLIHTGREFHRLIDFFPGVLEKLISEFTNLRIGIQNRRRLEKKMGGVISNDEDIKRLEEKFFQVSR